MLTACIDTHTPRRNRDTWLWRSPPATLPWQEPDATLQVNKATVGSECVELRFNGQFGYLRVPFRKAFSRFSKALGLLS